MKQEFDSQRTLAAMLARQGVIMTCDGPSYIKTAPACDVVAQQIEAGSHFGNGEDANDGFPSPSLR